jgi:hypothetical protein
MDSNKNQSDIEKENNDPTIKRDGRFSMLYSQLDYLECFMKVKKQQKKMMTRNLNK